MDADGISPPFVSTVLMNFVENSITPNLMGRLFSYNEIIMSTDYITQKKEVTRVIFAVMKCNKELRSKKTKTCLKPTS